MTTSPPRNEPTGPEPSRSTGSPSASAPASTSASTSPGRRPLGPRWEDAVEQSIQDAMRRGEFDRLPGTGQPIAGLDGPHDELWWVKDKLRREEISTIPPSLAVRRDRDELRAHLHTFTTERAVREAVEELNERIRKLNRYGSPSGPPTSLMPQDVDEYVARWREATTGDSTPA